MTHELIGVSLGEYTLRRHLGSGAFAEVYEGIDARTNQRRAFKVARRERARRTGTTEVVVSTLALMPASGAILNVRVDPSAVLRRQYEVLQRAGTPLYPRVEALLEHDGRAVVQMELMEAPTLGQLIREGRVPDGLPAALASALDGLERLHLPHGDLKPGNILWREGRVVLLDPGLPASLPLEPGSKSGVYITTPAYYPLCEPDDMMAFGLILVEMITGNNPLHISGGAEAGLMGRGLQDRIDALHQVGNRYLDGICGLSTRTAIGEKLACSPLYPVAEKCLGLDFGSTVNTGPKYPGFAAVEAALRELPRTLLSKPYPRPIRCFDCGQPVAGEERCPHCNAPRTAPRCPYCDLPVSRVLNQRVPPGGFPDWRNIPDRLSWNAHWDGRCAGCGREFAAKIKVATGHYPASIGAGDPQLADEFASRQPQSIIRIEGGESVQGFCDFWDYQPVIQVEIHRAAAPRHEEQLPAHSAIMLTVAECQTLLDKLQGGLRPILDRRAWSRDTT